MGAQSTRRGRLPTKAGQDITLIDQLPEHVEAIQKLRERLGPLSPEAKHQVLAGGALGFYGLS